MGDFKWPSFIIQGVILATTTTFMIKGGGYINTWMLLSLLSILFLFSLQTTSTDFLYLYRVANGKKAPNYKTYILRITTMLSILFLYLGVYHPNSEKETLSQCWFNGYFVTVIIAFFFLLVVPILFDLLEKKKA